MVDISNWSRSDLIALWALIVSVISLAIAVGLPILGFFRSRPRIKLSTTWRYQPGNADQLLSIRIVREEAYYCDFRVENAGLTANQINEVHIAGRGADDVEIRLGELTIGGTKKYLSLPKQLARGESYKFTHWFTPDQFKQIQKRKHYMHIQAGKTFRIRIRAKL
ncbi:hypothetical protein [Cereibacter changlensis]|uniref:hypothetical protein n=1 Tax=Cereibacter changlensis TaxID=402884 RepID=UPI0040336D2D